MKLAIDVNKAEHIAGVRELLSANGFTPGRYYQRMERPLGELEHVALPEGPRVEPWSARHDEDFRATRNKTFADLAVPMPAELWRNKITNQTFRAGLSFLLRDATEPVSLVVTIFWDADTEATGIRDAHFMVVGTVPAHQRRGAAGALLRHALQAAKDQGYDQASLRVESSGNAGPPRIFERAGFEPDIRYVRWALDVSHNPVAGSAQCSTRPPTTVASTRMPGTESTATAAGLSEKITRSAYLPGARLPFTSSSKVPNAASAVNNRNVCSTVKRCHSCQSAGARPR